MRRVATVLSVAAMMLVAVSAYAQDKPNFSGTWTMDAAEGGGGGGGGRGGRGGRGGFGQEFTAKQDASTLTITRSMGDNTVTMTYKLDGSESKNMQMGRGGETEVVSKAMWDGAKLVITTTLGQGERRQALSLANGKLVIETTQPGRGGGDPTTSTQTYSKSM